MSDFPDDMEKQLKKSNVTGNSHKPEKDLTVSNDLKLVISP